MNLHTDLPTRAQVERLLRSRHPTTVSIYLPTDPASTGAAEQIELKNLAAEARRQLEEGGHAASDVAAVEDAIAELDGDVPFWRHQARSLALFVTPEALTTFRLPNQLIGLVEVSDRFHVKPLLRAITFPNVGFILALAQGSVRLVEVAPDIEPAEITVPDLPSDVASASGKTFIKNRSPSGRVQGSKGQKLRMRQYARQVDQALRPLLNGIDVPLVLAASEPLDSIFRSVNSYPYLAQESISGNPEATSNSELVASARTILDELYAAELRAIHELFSQREGEHRAFADLADVAKAATYGAVDTLLVDIDESVPGFIDDAGAVTLADTDDAVNYGVVDEIVRRVWLSGGRVLAVRRNDVPRESSIAAILRYAI